MSRRAVWQKTLAELGEERGFYRKLGPRHNALFLRGDGTLVVSFDNLDDARQDVAERMPWGSQFISSRGWSSLGIGAHGWTWYRDDAVLDFFDDLAAEGFFRQFENVVFYGTSMAGYAAGAFCSAAPGAKVIMMNPQATLDRSITGGWESRFSRSWRQDFTGRYSYAPDHARSASVVHLFFDPMVVEDAMHAALFQGDNIVKLKCRYFGHGLTSALSQMGILTPVVEACVGGRPSQTELYRMMRVRRFAPRYQKAILTKLKGKRWPRLTHDYCRAVLAHSDGKPRPHFYRAMQAAAKQMSAA
jgi:hypothetical protein